MAQLSAAAAYNITYACYVSDYSRYLPRDTLLGKRDRLGVRRGRDAGDLVDSLGAWLAIRLGAVDGLVGLQDRREPHVQPSRDRWRPLVSATSAGSDDGHERLRRHADDLGRHRSFARSRPRGARVWSPSLPLTVIWFVIAKSISTSAVGVVVTLSDAHAVPARAVDHGKQPDRLLLRPPWSLLIIDIFKPHGIYGVWSPQRPFLRRRGSSRDPVHGAAQSRHAEELLHRALRYAHQQRGITWIVGVIAAGIAYWLLTRNQEGPPRRATIGEAIGSWESEERRGPCHRAAQAWWRWLEAWPETGDAETRRRRTTNRAGSGGRRRRGWRWFPGVPGSAAERGPPGPLGNKGAAPGQRQGRRRSVAPRL